MFPFPTGIATSANSSSPCETVPCSRRDVPAERIATGSSVKAAALRPGSEYRVGVTTRGDCETTDISKTLAFVLAAALE